MLENSRTQAFFTIYIEQLGWHIFGRSVRGQDSFIPTLEFSVRH